MTEVRESFPMWEIGDTEAPNPLLPTVALRCPRCENLLWVVEPAWRSYDGSTKPCPYCFKASRVTSEDSTKESDDGDRPA